MLLFLLLPWTVHAEPRIPDAPEYSLQVSFDISRSRVSGKAVVAVQGGREIRLQTGDLAIQEITQNSRKVPFEMQNGSVRTVRMTPLQDGTVEIRYEGVFKDDTAGGGTNYGVVGNSIGTEGVSLTGLWYPRPDSLHTYRLEATLPAAYTALSEAEEVRQTVKGDAVEFSFVFPHPVDGISFVASDRYTVLKQEFNGIELYAYFFPSERELAPTYLDYAKKYLSLYGERFGAYPYRRFAVVENFLPSGYSMPTFTLLGRDVVKLPFIVETSLGHEIAHQWFGNSVYIEYEKGNWAEGLTTYVADHFYEEQKGRGWEYRKQMLIDYESYVNPARDFPLKDFKGREDTASKAIGYGKAAMVFHMLKKTVGDDAFSIALKEFVRENLFRKASWEDIRKSFEKASGKDLEGFFKQWVATAGVPEIYFGGFTIGRSYDSNDGKAEVGFSAGQKSNVYALDIPVTLYFREGSREEVTVRLDKAKISGTLAPPSLPEKIVVDGDYDVMRRLSEGEIPPVLARLIGEEKPLVVLPEGEKEIYSPVIKTFKERGATVKGASDLTDTEVHSSSMVILGNGNPLVSRLFGSLPRPDEGFTAVVKKNPWDPRKVVGIFHGKSKEEVEAAFRKIFHYGKYGYLAFSGGRNVEKRTEESRRGLAVWSREQTTAVDTSTIRTLNDVIESVSGKKIVYVGEYHDRFSHHAVQLEVIKGLYRKNRKLAIGMEMFQTPYQEVLDDYIAGKADEKEFLRKSEYFKRWAFDYRLYKPILDFARAEGIPVVALNIPREIVEKVSRKGIDALSDEDKKLIPPQMDFSESEYRERLREVFQRHAGSGERNFDYFYQSQILWDETMAQSIDAFFRQRPDFQKEGQMVVIAGGGHISYGVGIPKRAFRRNGYSYATLLSDVEVEKDIADYILFPKEIEVVPTPKLMVSLKEEQGKVIIEGFSENSVSEKAGLREGDVILSLDGVPVGSVDDMKIHLLSKRKGDTVRVRILRKSLLLGGREMEFTVTL